MFRSTTVTVRDNFNGIPQSALINSAKKEQEIDFALLHSSNAASNITSVTRFSPDHTNNSEADANKLGDQMQGLHGHKVGFSFAFPKKASVKLESSAAVFYEFNDEVSAEHGLSRRSRFFPGPCNLQSAAAEEIIVCSEEKPHSIAPSADKHNDKTEFSPLQDANELSSEENPEQEIMVRSPSFSHLKEPGLGESDSFSMNVDLPSLPDDRPSTVAPGNQALPAERKSDEHKGSKCTGLSVNEDGLSQQALRKENDQNVTSDSPTNEVAIKKDLPDGLTPAHSEGEPTALPSKPDSHKRLCEPFVPVLNKHGSNILQWPSEMLIYTTTEPSISYSCNPLYFDFRSSKSSECLEKVKPQANMSISSHKSESRQGLVLDYTDKSLSVDADSTADTNTHSCNRATSVTMDISVPEDCNPEKNQDEFTLDASSETVINKKYDNPSKYLQEMSSSDGEYNRCWIKRTHEKWLHKNRKRKRRRKLCYHHYDKAANTISPVVEQQNNGVEDADNHHQLHNTLEKGVGENESRDSVMEQLQQSHETLGLESSSCSGTISMFTQLQGSQSPCLIFNTKDNKDDCIHSKIMCRRNKPMSHRQSNKPGLNLDRRNSISSTDFCTWSIRSSSSSLDHKHSGHYPDEKCTNQIPPIKRTYTSLSDEPEKFHRKRRHHIFSCSSDESSNAQICFIDENLRHTHNEEAPFKPKRKRRRKRTRVHHALLERAPRRNINSPPEASVVINSQVISTQDSVEQSITDYANGTEKTTESVESQPGLQSEPSLSSESIQESNCSVTETVPCMPSASSLTKHDVLETKKPENLPQKEDKHENTIIPEIQAPPKMISIERNMDPPLPKTYLCNYEVAESTTPQEKLSPSSNEWLRYNPGIFNAPPPLPFKEAHLNSHAFLTTEQIFTPFPWPEHPLLLPPENHDKFKDLQCEAYHQIVQQNMLASKMKLTFPPTAMPTSNALLQPLPFQQPLCSTSVTTTIHHTILQQHAAAAAAAASTFQVLQPHQFLSPLPTLSRTPLPHLSVGPRLCPAGHAALVGPPQLPLIPTSVLHPNHLAFPPLPHSLFPSLLSPHPAVIPLQPLF